MANNRRSKKELAESYLYFDEELYKDRFVIEKTNARLDDFKGLLMRFKKNKKLDGTALAGFLCPSAAQTQYLFKYLTASIFKR